MARVSSRRLVLPLLLLVGLTFLAYAPAMRAGFIWDDDDYVTENPLLLDAPGLVDIWTTTQTPQYYPMVFTTFWIEHKLWGLAPAGYHGVNIALHGLNAFLVGLILLRLGVPARGGSRCCSRCTPCTSSRWPGSPSARTCSPVCSTCCRSWPICASTARARPGSTCWRWGIFVLALLSKTVTASLPVALGLALFWRHGRLRRQDLARLTPFLLLGAGLALITVGLEGDMVGIVGADFGFSWWQRLGIACSALLFYPFKVLWPYPLIFNYPRWEIDSGGVWWIVAPLVVTGLVVVLFRLWQRGLRGIVLAAAFYAFTVFPALGFLDVYPFRYSFVADHFQYLASIGTLIVVVQVAIAGGHRLVERFGGATAPTLRVGAVVAVMVLSILTWQQGLIYHDLATLWRETIEDNPRSWLALNNLGLIYMNSGEYDKALGLLDRAVEVKPEATESHTARGMTLSRTGDAEAAFACAGPCHRARPDLPAGASQSRQPLPRSRSR